MPGGFSNTSMFSSGRYTVLHALGIDTPADAGSFDDLADIYVETKEEPYSWNSPDCSTEIAVW